MADGALHPDPAKIDHLADRWNEFGNDLNNLHGAVDLLINTRWSGPAATQSDRVGTAIKARITEIVEGCHSMATGLKEMAEEVRKAIRAHKAAKLIELLNLILTIVGAA